MAPNLETIVSLCKRRGFIFPSSEIYGGLASAYDFGPLGVELIRNVKEAWWRAMVHERDDIEGLDCAIMTHPEVWRASGHLDSFTDPLVECRNCRKRFRSDHLKNYTAKYRKPGEGADPSNTNLVTLGAEVPPPELEFIESEIACPECGQKQLSEPRFFNLMFQTNIGPVQESGSTVFMRPETAQGMFVNFENVRGAMRRKLPFGIAQIGKSFRNEITTKAFIFRTLEFEQMEMEYFVKPGEDEKWHDYWLQERFNWYVRYGIARENLRLREHGPKELAHYSRRCLDVEYNFPMGWQELEGIANRTDYDLTQHMKFSKKDLTYFDQGEERRYTPYVIEPAAGVARSTLAFLIDAYDEETVKDRKRVVLRLHHALAPIKIAVLPLLRNRPEIVQMARGLTADLKRRWLTRYDDTASIGKLYRRQDEIGTPFCLTVDVESLEDKQVTVRERDSMEQSRVPLDGVAEYLTQRLNLHPARVEDPI